MIQPLAHRFPVLAALAALILLSCGDDQPTSAPNAESDAGADTSGELDTQQDTAPGTDTGSGDAPILPDLGEGWTIIEPGGDTICSRGTPFRFAVRAGTTNRVVVDFMGGGACWDALTCGLAGAIFNEDVDDLEDYTDQVSGIYDVTNPENPFADWFHVFIPYCTGDIHWGDSDTTYGEGDDAFVVRHRGQANVRAVLAWLEENMNAPEDVFVTGCSAGAYGSIMWAPTIIEQYPAAQVAHFGDSGAGIITEEFFRDSFPSWNPNDAFPAFIPTLDPAFNDFLSLTASDLYGRIAEYYPEVAFTQYHTAFDDNQTFYFEAMGGGDQFAWSEQMYEAMDYAESLSPNVRTYIAPGEQHCIIPYENFYTVESNGVLLTDWINALVAGEIPDSVRCTDCEPPEN